jgi:anti-sigma B factor antagonist
MDEKKIEIQEEDKGRYYYLKANGYLSSTNILEIRKRLENALSPGRSKIALDLSGIQFIDSMGLGLLINFCRKIKDAGGTFYIVNPSPAASSIIHVSGSAKVLEIREGVTDVNSLFQAII